MNILIAIVTLLITNIIFIAIGYDESIRSVAWKSYALSVFASLCGSLGYTYFLRSLARQQIFVANLVWDVAIVILCIILPVIFYKIKLDSAAVIGSVIAVIGIIIAKYGSAG